ADHVYRRRELRRDGGPALPCRPDVRQRLRRRWLRAVAARGLSVTRVGISPGVALDVGPEVRPMIRRSLSLMPLLLGAAWLAPADETCMSPYLPKITGQEDYVYAWTLGVEGLGDGSDKLVTICATPRS